MHRASPQLRATRPADKEKTPLGGGSMSPPRALVSAERIHLMRHCLTALLMVLAAALLAGCETVSKEQCVAGDWSEIGRAHAAQGYPSSRFDDVIKDCGRHGITPDPQAYMSGWDQGVQLYCTPLNGFNLGRQNTSLSPICPPNLVAEAERAHRLGKRIWTTRDKVTQLERRIDNRQSEIDRLRSELDRIDCREKKGDERIACRDRQNDLRQKVQDARFEIQDARFELNDRRRDYELTVAQVDEEARRTIPGYRQ